MGNMGPFGNMIHQEENEYMYIIHAQMILESKCILTEISITPSLSPTIYKFETSQRFIALMCFTKVTQSYFIVDNLQFKKILLHFRIIKGMPQRGQIPSCKCTTSHALGAQCNQ